MWKHFLWITFAKKFFTSPVERFPFIHTGLWIKKPCASKQKSTFPHKIFLLLLRLPYLTFDRYILNPNTRKELDHAFYL